MRPAPKSLDSGTGTLSITQATLASLRIAINQSGASLKEPFVTPRGRPAASTSSLSVGSVWRYSSMLRMLACPSHNETFRTSPVASSVCMAQEWRLSRAQDRRHTAASHAVMSGENLPLVGKLLGHRRHQTTAGYAHLADGHLVETAENVGSLIAEAMRLHSAPPSSRPCSRRRYGR